MSRGVQGINLRIGQDFDGEMDGLMQIVDTEIEWQLDVALPDLKGVLKAADREDELKTAEYHSVHAPTNLHPDGPRWWELAPVISRLITIFDRLRDFPRARERRKRPAPSPWAQRGRARPIQSLVSPSSRLSCPRDPESNGMIP
jgi:hypothetical protein